DCQVTSLTMAAQLNATYLARYLIHILAAPARVDAFFAGDENGSGEGERALMCFLKGWVVPTLLADAPTDDDRVLSQTLACHLLVSPMTRYVSIPIFLGHPQSLYPPSV
ncbi:hypothetical protein KIPB_016290, partial [Kipferlia bialata]